MKICFANYYLAKHIFSGSELHLFPALVNAITVVNVSVVLALTAIVTL